MTGEPGKAPAWNLKMPSAAVILPSFVTPILTHIEPPEVGPVALKTSSRVIVILMGRPGFCDSNAATDARETTVVPPNPPPISAGEQRTSPTGLFSNFAVSARTTKCPWLDDQISVCPSGWTRTQQACGSI